MSYTTKHAALHGRSNVYNPYSIRQMGLHHKHDAISKSNTFVILNPCDAVTKRIQYLPSSVSAADIHVLVLGVATQNWNDYLDYLEVQCADTVCLNLHSALKGIFNIS